MAYNSYQANSYDESGKLAWDLRQFYARWVAKYMIDFKIAEENDSYPTMFRALCRWHSSAKHEWQEDGIDEDWAKLKDEFAKLSNKYRSAYFGKSFKSSEVSSIEESLQTMKEYLLYHMKNSGMFGATWDDDGL